jgi:mannonate dehydratase
VRLAVGQMQRLDDETAAFARQLGIGGVQLNTPELPETDGGWALADLIAVRERCERHGLRLEAIENLPPRFYVDVMLGRAGAERQLANVRRTILAVGAAGIPVLGYHFMPHFVWRTSIEEGRGGARVTAFDAAAVPQGNLIEYDYASLDEHPSLEQMWDNYQAFLDVALPAAEEAGIRLALHPDDPPTEQLGEAVRLFNRPERLIEAHRRAGGSPAWALNFCLGTVSSMEGGAEAVDAVLEHFVPRRAVAYVHVRQVQGTVPAFRECFLGEGNFDLPRVLRRLAELEFDGFLLDDHVPETVGDTPWGHRARAHAIGYVQGILAGL